MKLECPNCHHENPEKAPEEELKEYPKGKSTEKILYALFVAKIDRKSENRKKVIKKIISNLR